MIYLRTELGHHEISVGVTEPAATDDPANLVLLELEARTGETFDDHEIRRLLLPHEAREVAAMLRHYADEVDPARRP